MSTPDEINGVGGGPCLIKIVYTPDQAAFEVAPGSEIVDVQIPDGQDPRGAREFRANKRPPLGQPIKRRAEKGEGGLGHVGVLQVEHQNGSD